MKIKVQCPCGTRFEFEVEPVNGRMPMPINCPSCGADATGLANDIIRQQSASAAPASAPAGLRISHSAHPAPAAAHPAAAAVESDVPHCFRHQSEPAAEACCVCGKPICLKCMEQFGHVCSVYCRQQAERKGIEVPVYGRQKNVVAGRTAALAKVITFAVVGVVVVVVGLWFW